MQRTPVSSSNLSSVGYDPGTQTLEVAFHHGGIYQYYGVPESIYRGLISAASKGSFLDSRIKGAYRYNKVN
ncbi:MAG: KTSC domain-containing protein [Fibrobacterota bacterium]